MRYNKSERIQHQSYCTLIHLLSDVLETLFDDASEGIVHIITDTYMAERLLRLLCQIETEEFDPALISVNFDYENDEIDEYRISILSDGEIFIEPAIDKDAKYYDCDGFIFAESEVSEDAYQGNNRRCDVMVFDVCNID